MTENGGIESNSIMNNLFFYLAQSRNTGFSIKILCLTFQPFVFISILPANGRRTLSYAFCHGPLKIRDLGFTAFNLKEQVRATSLLCRLFCKVELSDIANTDSIHKMKVAFIMRVTVLFFFCRRIMKFLCHSFMNKSSSRGKRKRTNPLLSSMSL